MVNAITIIKTNILVKMRVFISNSSVEMKIKILKCIKYNKNILVVFI